MKKFIAFGGSFYYPNGGMRDCIGTFETLEEAKEKIQECHEDWGHLNDWGHVYDMESQEMVFSWTITKGEII